MKKFFSFLLALTASVAVNAFTVTFTFNNPDSIAKYGFAAPAAGQSTNIESKTIDSLGVKLAFTNGSTKTRFYQGSGANAGKYDLRIYKSGGSVTVSVEGTDKINEVSFTGSGIANFKVGDDDVVAEKWQSVEGVASVKFDASATVTLYTMTVKVNEEVTPFVCNDLDTLTVAQAVERINNDDEYNHCPHILVGVLDSIQSSIDGKPVDAALAETGYLILWLRDAENRSDSINCYKIYKGVNEEKYVSINELEFNLGDTIYIYTEALEMYTKTTVVPNVTFPEAAVGYYYGRIGESPRKVIGIDALAVVPGLFGDEFEFTLSKAGTSVLVGFNSMTNNVNSLVGSYTVPANTVLTLEDASTVTLTGGSLEIALKSMTKDTMNYTVIFVGYDNVEGKTYFSQFAYRDSIFTDDNTNITAARAYEIASALASGAKTETKYYIYGYYGSIAGKYAWTEAKKFQTFWMADVPGTTKGNFEVYNASGFNTAADTAVMGDYVYVKGALLTNYNGTPETSGSVSMARVNVNTMPKLLDVKAPEKTISEIVDLMADKANYYKTPVYYTIKGFVKEITMDDADATKVKSFVMSETAEGGAEFTGYRCRTIEGESAVNVGDEVSLRGAVKKYIGKDDQGADLPAIYEIEGGRMEILSTTALPEALIERSHKQVVKTVDNGQIVIIKNGVRYNVLGGAIR